MRRFTPALACMLSGASLLGLAPTLHAQASINTARKYAWTENCGWTNWRDANGAASGVRMHASFLSGWIWSENLGWITVGDGLPENGTSYNNITGADFGVNILPGGDLAGLAWSENAGWINFGPLASLATELRARWDSSAKRFRGYAWSENVGWLNLDDPTKFVNTCAADFNTDGVISAADIFDFLNAWFASSPSADFDGVNGVVAQDIFDFLNAWFAGCA